MPPPDLTVSQWADANRILSSKTSALPGPWETSFNPMMREPMDECSNPLTSEVTFVGPRQIAKTASLTENPCGYFMEHDPAQIGVFFENQEKSDNWSKTRFQSMVEETPCLRDKVVFGKGPTSANTLGYTDFPGGFIVRLSAGSDANVASYSLRILICEEMSKYPKTKLGDTYERIRALATTFFNAKIINVTTPTIWIEDAEEEVGSDIQLCRGTARYLESDQRIPVMTCPFCGHEQQMLEERFNFRKPDFKERTVEEVWYECANPACPIGKVKEIHKPQIIANGKWVAQKPFKGHAGFAHYPALWSPWVSWVKYGNAYLRMKRQPETYKTFVNEWRGEPYDPRMEAQKEVNVYTSRCEDYGDVVPAEAIILTAACDIQADRIECEVKAWDADRQSWGVDFQIFEGKPHLLTDTNKLPLVWQALDAYLHKTWTHEYGMVMGLDYVLVDQGFLLDEVQKFCKPRRGRNIRPCRGMSTPAHELAGRAKKNTRMKVSYFPIGTNRAKEIIFGNGALEEKGPGFMHWNKRFDAAYFKQLFTSEKVIKILPGGVKVYGKVFENARNEALDLNVYNLAAFELARPLIPLRLQQWAEAKRAYEASQAALRGEAIVEKVQLQEQQKRTGRRIISKGVID